MKMVISNVTAATFGTGFTINTPLTGGAGLSPDAVGGSKVYPLPYPATFVGPLSSVTAGSANVVTIDMHVDDMSAKSVPWLPLTPSQEWQQLINMGIVTVTFTQATVNNNVADKAATAV